MAALWPAQGGIQILGSRSTEDAWRRSCLRRSTYPPCVWRSRLSCSCTIGDARACRTQGPSSKFALHITSPFRLVVIFKDLVKGRHWTRVLFHYFRREVWLFVTSKRNCATSARIATRSSYLRRNRQQENRWAPRRKQYWVRISSLCVSEMELARDVKEKPCYICLDFDTEHKWTAEKTFELPDENFVTVGAKRFRYVRGSPRHFLPEQREVWRWHPQEDLRVPRRKHHQCWRWTLPLRWSVFPVKRHWKQKPAESMTSLSEATWDATFTSARSCTPIRVVKRHDHVPRDCWAYHERIDDIGSVWRRRSPSMWKCSIWIGESILSPSKFSADVDLRMSSRLAKAMYEADSESTHVSSASDQWICFLISCLSWWYILCSFFCIDHPFTVSLLFYHLSENLKMTSTGD